MSHLDHVMYEHRYYGRDVTYADLLKIKEEVENRQPQPQASQPLSDEQISSIYRQLTDEARKTGDPKFGNVLSVARAIEQAHGITKGTP